MSGLILVRAQRLLCEIVPSHCSPAALLLLAAKVCGLAESHGFIYLFRQNAKVCTVFTVPVAQCMVVRWCHRHPGLVVMR